jgi:hypothetical protein
MAERMDSHATCIKQLNADGQVFPKRPFKFGHHSVSLESVKAAVRNLSGAKQDQ